MTIKEAQTTVDEWINTIGIRYYSELTNTAVLMEEVGEIARLMARKIIGLGPAGTGAVRQPVAPTVSAPFPSPPAAL